MSTFMYAQVTEQREKAESGTSTTSNPPSTSTWLDAVTVLVPSEVLAIHVFLISKFTTTKEVENDGSVVVQEAGGAETVNPPDDATVTVITDPTWLKWSFWALVVLAVVIYVGKKWHEWKPLDFARVWLAPAAFVLWAMLTPNSAFDAAFPGDLTEARREVIAVFGAVVIGVVAKLLADRADKA
jgi:hypothetical protein